MVSLSDAGFAQDISEHRERINKAKRKLRKRQKQLIRYTGGYRAELIMRMMDKQAGATQVAPASASAVHKVRDP